MQWWDVCGRALEFLVAWEGSLGICCRRQPDSGKPTVRDEMGAYGNVSYGGTGNPPHIPKGCGAETLRLMLRAPLFYPIADRGIPRGSAALHTPAGYARR